MCKILNVKRGSFFIFLMILLVSFAAKSQDIHSSQFWLQPVGLNPAAAGFFDGTFRFGGYNRTQWRSVSKPFQTNGIYADWASKRPAKQDLLGFGVMMDYDQAGDSRYTTIDANMLFSYAHALNYRNNNFLMGGISLGCVQRSWDYTQLSFGEQYVDGFYDPKSPISETFTESNIWFFDCGLGMQWFYQPAYNEFYQVGFSVYHLNLPEISMLADKEIRLPIKYVFHAVTSLAMDNRKKAIIPSAYLAFQKQYREIIFGATYSHQLPLDAKAYLNKIKTGLYFRWNDAIYLTAGMDYRQCVFSISYDFNVSQLRKGSHVRGGVEISASYIVKKQKFKRIVPIPCTVFEK